MVLPFNHESESVDRPLKLLLRQLATCDVPMRALLSKTLLICPSNFGGMDVEDFTAQTQRVSHGLLHLIQLQTGS